MRWLLLAVLPGLLVPALAAPAALGQADAATIPLYAHWPESLSTAMEQPIPMTTLYPAGEPDLSAGPLTPGSSTADTLPTFTYRLINPNGTDGPYGDVALDPSRPLLVDFYLSADDTPWPAAVGDPPEDVDAGVAPEITLNATLRIGGQTVSSSEQTQTLVSAPDPIAQPVQRYVVELPLDHAELERGEGLYVDLVIEQVDEAGERAVQPGFNVHTGEDYPTHVELPVEPSERLSRGAPTDTDDGFDVSGYTAETRDARVVAVGVLIAATLVAAVAGVRLLGFED